tara:strand:+ start:2593 stop:3768 length:1176 start_codon:yes stop_codon:yes gene_type:complete
MAKQIENPRDLIDFNGLGDAFGGAVSNVNLQDFLNNIFGFTNVNNTNVNNTDVNNTGSYQPITDTNFTSGLYYAGNNASGQNVPNMITPGVSYSSAMPQGYSTGATQAPPIFQPAPAPPTDDPIETDDPIYVPPFSFDDDPIYVPPFGFDQGGPVLPPGTPPVDDPIEVPPIIFDDDPIFPPINEGGPIKYPPPTDDGIEGPIDVPPPGFYDYPPTDDPIFPPINEGGPIKYPPPTDDGIEGPIDVPPPGFYDYPPTDDPIYVPPFGFDQGGPVLPPTKGTIDVPPPFDFDEVISGPIEMSPQEKAKLSSQQELLKLLSSKDVLSQIPADDGVRNQYQVELDEFINESPINMETYKEELPVDSAFNLGIPSSISSSFTPGINYSSVKKLGK